MSERAPDLFEEIVGWRAWEVDETALGFGRPALRSVTMFGEETVWPARAWLVAVCEAGREHEAPSDFCACGIYAARDRSHLVRQGYHDAEAVIAIGRAALAGRVKRCERGYRAEKARPLELWLPYSAWELVAPLRERYGIPVRLDNAYAIREEFAWT